MTFKNDIFILRCSLILKISIILTAVIWEGETFHMREFYKSEVEEIFAAKKKILLTAFLLGMGLLILLDFSLYICKINCGTERAIASEVQHLFSITQKIT